MQNLALRVILLSIVAIVLAGCGDSQPDGSQFQHDQAATLFLEAMKARQTNQTRALELLTQSIEARPSYNAYYQRGWIHALRGREDEATADVAAGLKLEPENRELKWLEGELMKPANQRNLDAPPSQVK